MDGYELQAASYEQYLETHPVEPEVKEDLERKIKVLRLFIGTTEQERDEMFNSGAFNDICKGYFKKAMKNCDIPDATIATVLDEFKWLLDTMNATDARKI